jgi:hypothetical protein
MAPVAAGRGRNQGWVVCHEVWSEPVSKYAPCFPEADIGSFRFDRRHRPKRVAVVEADLWKVELQGHAEPVCNPGKEFAEAVISDWHHFRPVTF